MHVLELPGLAMHRPPSCANYLLSENNRDRDRDRDRVAVLGRHTKSQKQRQKQNRQEVETRGRGRGGDSAGKENRHAGFQAGVTETGKPAVTGKSSASKIAFIAASSAGP